MAGDGAALTNDQPDCCPSRRQLAPTPPEHAAPGSGVWGPFSYFATNAGSRGSDALVRVSCRPHALATTGEFSPGNGLSSPYEYLPTTPARIATWSAGRSGLYVTQTAPCSSECTACSFFTGVV